MAKGKNIHCADLLKVLANETRLRVVQQLLEGPKNVGEMNLELQVEKSLLSHHLKALRSHGIVNTRREGKTIEYRLAPEIASSRRSTGLDFGCCKLVFLEP